MVLVSSLIPELTRAWKFTQSTTLTSAENKTAPKSKIRIVLLLHIKHW